MRSTLTYTRFTALLLLCLSLVPVVAVAESDRGGRGEGGAGGSGGSGGTGGGNSGGGPGSGSSSPRIAEARISQDKENAKILNTQAVEFTKRLIDFQFLLPDSSTGGTVIFSTTKTIASSSNFTFTARNTTSPAYLTVKSCDANRLGRTDFAALFNRVGNTAYLNTTNSPQCHLVDTRIDFLSANRTTNKILVQATTQVATNAGPQPQVLQAELDTPAVCVEDTGDMTLVTTGANGAYGDPYAVRRAIADAITNNRLPYTGLVTATDVMIRMATNGTGTGNRWDAGTPDPDQMKEICKILGYRDFISADCHQPPAAQYTNGRCNYSSPDNNQLQYLDVANKRFITVGASPKYENNWLARITCRGRLNRCP